MKKFLFLLVSLLLVGCVSQSELDQAISQISDLEADIQEKDSDIASLETQLDGLEDAKLELDDEFEELQGEYEVVSAEKGELQLQYEEARRKVTSLTSQLNDMVCDDQLDDMKYQNILDASTILSAWWARQPGVETVQGTYRDSIWSNADTKIHAVRFVSSQDHQPYVEHFLVYFDEFGMDPGVFWVGGQCWLDVP
jgi:ABC-type phosphate transport system auxiliary subunit